jgi:protein gp37
MAARSSIEWTEFTWNPVRGCSVVSPGCTHCYAMKLAHRFSGPGRPYEGLTRPSGGGGVWSGVVRPIPALLDQPLRWRSPRLVFVNSMSDLFHDEVPTSFIHEVFEVMRRANWHQFQVLTKRAARLVEFGSALSWPANVWMGVSVENERQLDRVDHSRRGPSAVRFLSLEPLLGPLPSLNLDGIGWVIVGGESGPGARTIRAEWVREIRDHCLDAGVPFFFKQWGGFRKKRTGRELDGRTWDGMPVSASDAA